MTAVQKPSDFGRQSWREIFGIMKRSRILSAQFLLWVSAIVPMIVAAVIPQRFLQLSLAGAGWNVFQGMVLMFGASYNSSRESQQGAYNLIRKSGWLLLPSVIIPLAWYFGHGIADRWIWLIPALVGGGGFLALMSGMFMAYLLFTYLNNRESYRGMWLLLLGNAVGIVAILIAFVATDVPDELISDPGIYFANATVAMLGGTAPRWMKISTWGGLLLSALPAVGVVVAFLQAAEDPDVTAMKEKDVKARIAAVYAKLEKEERRRQRRSKIRLRK